MTPTQQLQEDVKGLGERLQAVEDKVSNLFVTKGPERDLAVAAPKQPLSEKVLQELGESDPVKVDFIEKVQQKLNKSFGNHIKFSDRGFAYTIIVPEKYSNFTDEQKKAGALDLRTRVIPFAEGVLGVETWADIVWKNFNPDIQAMITADRNVV